MKADLGYYAIICVALILIGIYSLLHFPSTWDWVILVGGVLGLIGTLAKRAKLPRDGR